MRSKLAALRRSVPHMEGSESLTIVITLQINSLAAV